MNALVSVASVAGVPVALSSSAICAIPHPDAELLALGEQLRIAQQEVAIILKRHAIEHREYEARRIPLPAVCHPRPGDIDALGEGFGKGHRFDGAFNDSQIERLRTLKEEDWRIEIETRKFPDGDEIPSWKRTRVKRDLARRAEIVAAYDEWNAADTALRREIGADRWDEEVDLVSKAQHETEHEIMSTPARSIEGLRVKAEAALAYDGALREATLRDGRPETPAPEDGIALEDVVTQLAWDIIDMTTAARAGRV